MEKFNDKWKKNLINNIGYGKTSVDNDLLIEWAEENNIKIKNTCVNSWIRLLKNKFNNRDEYGIKNPPHQDHPKLFERFDGTRIFTYQPYKPEEMIIEDGLYEWAEERGLKITYIGKEKSWYYKGKTTLVQIEIGNEDKFIKYMKDNKVGL